MGLCPRRAGDTGPPLSIAHPVTFCLPLSDDYGLSRLGECIPEHSAKALQPAAAGLPLGRRPTRGGAGRGGTGRSLRTCTGLICTCEARHCTLRLLQQPEQRCTSTQGGHTRKLALVRSMRFREIWNTSVRVLHSAITAGSAAAREPEGGATEEAVRRGRSSLEPSPIQTALNLAGPP